MAGTAAARAADRLTGELRYGDRIRLATESCYISPRRWGYLGWYEKHHRLQLQNKGILSVISPLWIEEKDAGGGHDDGFDENAAFVASEFTVVSAKNERSSFGKRVQWGDRLLLVDQNGLILNNKPAGSRSITITGYVGPRERGKRGEMHVCFTPSTQVSGAVAPALVACNDRQDSPPSDHDDADSDGHESGDEDGHAHHHGGASRSAGGGSPAPRRPDAPSPAPLLVQEVSASLSHLANTDSKYVHYGDHVHIDVPWSRRFRTGYNKRLTNFKKESSHIAGGYVCCDGHGGELSFTIVEAHHKHTRRASVHAHVPLHPPAKAKAAALAKATAKEKSAEGGDSDSNGRAGGSGPRPFRTMLRINAAAVWRVLATRPASTLAVVAVVCATAMMMTPPGWIPYLHHHLHHRFPPELSSLAAAAAAGPSRWLHRHRTVHTNPPRADVDGSGGSDGSGEVGEIGGGGASGVVSGIAVAAFVLLTVGTVAVVLLGRRRARLRKGSDEDAGRRRSSAAAYVMKAVTPSPKAHRMHRGIADVPRTLTQEESKWGRVKTGGGGGGGGGEEEAAAGGDEAGVPAPAAEQAAERGATEGAAGEGEAVAATTPSRRRIRRSDTARMASTPVADMDGSVVDQERNVVQALRDALADVDCSPHLKDDLTLMRFVRARNLKLPAAEAMWRAHIAWRKEYQLDDPIEGPLAWDEERPAEGILCAEWYPVGRHGRDYQGRPVVFIRAGHGDIPGIVEQAGLPVLIKHCVVQQMRLLQSLRAASFRTGNMRFGAIIVMDMKGLGRRHFKALKLFNEVKKVSSRRI